MASLSRRVRSWIRNAALLLSSLLGLAFLVLVLVWFASNP